MINKIGGKFLVMTATLPRIYKEKLIEMGVPFKSEEFLSETKRHKIKLENKEITEDKYKEIYENLKNNILYTKNYYDNLYNILEKPICDKCVTKIKEEIDKTKSLNNLLK